VACLLIRVLSSSKCRKSFVGYDAQQRASVVKVLLELACPLSHDASQACSRPTGQDLPLLSTYHIAIRQIIRGTPDEVTTAVRKLGNQALSSAVRHHSLDLGLTEVDDLVIDMYQSLVHKDRAIRLSAGSVGFVCLIYDVLSQFSQVLVEIMSFYNRVGQISWIRAERIFDKFYELLRDARDSVKETVLITVGRVGRLASIQFLEQCTDHTAG
jgi:serine/threonine-protein kinase ATR